MEKNLVNLVPWIIPLQPFKTADSCCCPGKKVRTTAGLEMMLLQFEEEKKNRTGGAGDIQTFNLHHQHLLMTEQAAGKTDSKEESQ